MTGLKNYIRENTLSLCLIFATAVAIIVAGILSKQHILRMIPLFVSLIVGMLQAKASRYASLVGGINALLYTLVYYFFGLYASALSALLISSPFQLATLARWSKNSYKHSTRFRRLTVFWRIIVALGFAIIFAVAYMILTYVGSSYRGLDLGMSLISVFTSVLTLLSFIEYSWLMLGTGVCSILLDIQMMQDHPGQVTYLIFSIYSMICIIRQFISVRCLYNEQRRGEQNENAIS